MSTASPSPNEDVQRWAVKRKAAVVLDIIKGKTTPVEVARQHGLTVAEVERCVMTSSLKARRRIVFSARTYRTGSHDCHCQ